MKKVIGSIILVLVLASFFLMVFTGCRTVKENTSMSNRDSSFVEKLVPVYVQTPADSSWLKAYFKCDSLGNVYIAQLTDLKSKGINTSFDFKDGVVNYKTDRKADSILVWTINTKMVINKESTKTYTITKTEMSWIQKVFFWIGLVSVLILVGYLLNKYKGVLFN